MLVSLLLSAVSALTSSPASAKTAQPFTGFAWDTAQTTNEGALLPTDSLLFKFDLKEVKPTQFSPNGPKAFPASRGGRYSVGFYEGSLGSAPGNIPVIYAFTDGGCCSGHVMSLDLTTGHIYDHHQHSAGPWEQIDAPDPKKADDVKAYRAELTELARMLSELRAPQSTLNYLEQVQKTLADGNFRIEETLGADQTKIVSLLSIDTDAGATVTLAYNVSQDRDLLVDFFVTASGPSGGGDSNLWVGKGLVHVKAGKGTVAVPVMLAKTIEADPNWISTLDAYAKVIPTGLDYKSMLSQDKTTLYY